MNVGTQRRRQKVYPHKIRRDATFIDHHPFGIAIPCLSLHIDDAGDMLLASQCFFTRHPLASKKATDIITYLTNPLVLQYSPLQRSHNGILGYMRTGDYVQLGCEQDIIQERIVW